MRFLLAVSCVLLLVMLPACNGGSSNSTSTSPDPVATSSGPTAADISATILGASGVATGQGNAIAFGIRLSESAGVDARINFVRVDVYRATGQFEERQEIGAGEITRQTGSNRLEGGETRDLTVVIGFRATVKKGRILRITVGTTDDFGNDTDFVADLVFS